MIQGLDHLVLTVRDLAATARFYVEGLGMELREFGEGRKALHFGDQKINLHLAGREFEPKAAPHAGLRRPLLPDRAAACPDPWAPGSSRPCNHRGPGRAHRRHRPDHLDLHPRPRRQPDRDRAGAALKTTDLQTVGRRFGAYRARQSRPCPGAHRLVRPSRVASGDGMGGPKPAPATRRISGSAVGHRTPAANHGSDRGRPSRAGCRR
jgi:catechol 2,3-dioxygenase-like lactoylglutathione lyase family enzyme